MKRKISLLPAITLCLFLTTSVSAEIKPEDFKAAMDKYLASEDGPASITSAMQKYMEAQQARAQKDAEERQKAELEEQFTNPVKIDVGSSPVKGPANAKVTVFEFANFQCGYCSKGAATMAELMKAYPNDVKVVFKHLPLGFLKNSDSAARASLAANNQGKFWEFHDALYKNQTGLGQEFYEATAKTLGLNLDKFRADMESDAVRKQIAADVEQATKLDITGTPGFSVNGVMVRGAYPLEHFKGIVDKWLEKLK